MQAPINSLCLNLFLLQLSRSNPLHGIIYARLCSKRALWTISICTSFLPLKAQPSPFSLKKINNLKSVCTQKSIDQQNICDMGPNVQKVAKLCIIYLNLWLAESYKLFHLHKITRNMFKGYASCRFLCILHLLLAYSRALCPSLGKQIVQYFKDTFNCTKSKRLPYFQ